MAKFNSMRGILEALKKSTAIMEYTCSCTKADWDNCDCSGCIQAKRNHKILQHFGIEKTPGQEERCGGCGFRTNFFCPHHKKNIAVCVNCICPLCDVSKKKRVLINK